MNENTELIPVARWFTRNFNSSGEDKYLARSFFHCVSCNYLKSPKPGGPSHLLLLAKDNIFGPPIGAWFTLMEDDNHLVPLDLNSTHSNFSKNAFFST